MRSPGNRSEFSVRPRERTNAALLWLPGAFLLFLALGAWFREMPWAVPAAYLMCSVASFAWYAVDKQKARRGEWRTPESTLHLLDFIGGWPGGLFAQQRFRHKTRKLSFQLVFWLGVLLHLALWSRIYLTVPAETQLLPFLKGLVQSFAKLVS